jgi:phage terminase large subunit-like protein
MKRLSKQEYINDCWYKAGQYIVDIDNGAIVSNKWIKLAVKRYTDNCKSDDYELRKEEVDKVFGFFSVLNIDEFGLQFPILPFQCFIILNLFGLYIKGTIRRKYNYSFIFMARKNGKTQFVSALSLYNMISTPNPLCLSIGASPDARSHSARASAGLVYNTPALDKRLKPQGPQDSKNKVVFKDKRKQGALKSVVSIGERLDGYSTSQAVLDEVHSYPDDTLFNVVKSSTGSRFSNGENPLIVLISTAGFRPTGFCSDMINVGKRVMEGRLEDESFFYMIYTLDDEDNGKWGEPDLWIKANPALGTQVLDSEYLKGEYTQSRNLKTQLPNFLTKHLNIFVSETSDWIAESVYKKVCYNSDPSEYEHLTGFIGLDLSATRDLTALVVVFYDPDKEFYHVLPYFFRANNPDKRFRKGGQDLQEWINKGWIIESSKKTIDYNQVFEKIQEINNKYYIGSIVFDKYLSNLVIPRAQELHRQDGSPLVFEPFAQTSYKYSYPLSAFEKSIYDEQCSLTDNEVFQWNIDNVVLYYDTNGNCKPMKNKGKDAIDGIVAAAMAYSGALQWHNVNMENTSEE